MNGGPIWNQATQPSVNAMDFDPATYDPAQDVEEEGDDRGDGAKVELSSVEINILIYLYLLESNLSHTAFALLSETQLTSTSLFRYYNPHYPSPSSTKGKGVANGTPGPSKSPSEGTFGKSDRGIPRGELIRKLWKAVRWEAIERHVQPNGEPYPAQCPNPFHLLMPHSCPPSFASSASNPPPIASALTLSPIPPKAPEIFPPPAEEEPAAGPSRPKTSAKDEGTQTDAPGKVKRKSRRLSIGSERNEESTRSASPAPPPTVGKKKKRLRMSEGSDADSLRPSKVTEKDKDEENGMDVDEQDQNGTSGKGKGKGSAIVNGKVTPGSKKTKIRLKFGGESAAQSPKDSVAEDEMDLDEPGADKDSRGPLWLDEGDISVHTDHRDLVSCLAWNPRNLDVIATGSGDGSARMWDFHTDSDPRPRALVSRGKSLVMSHKSIDAGRKSVTCMAWHPDGTVLATGSQDGVGRLFTPSGHLQGILSYGRGIINALKFSPSGSTIIVAKTDFTVCLFLVGNNYNQDMKTCFDSHTKEVNDVDWLDDHVFASGGNDHTIFVFRDNDKRPRYTLKGHTDDVTRLSWSPAPNGDGDRLLASVSDDGNCLIWKLPSYPEDRGTSSRSISPVKPSTARETSGKEEDDYFAGSASLPGIDHCLQKLVVVANSENRRMDTVQWSPSCKEGRMIVAAGGQDSTVKLFDALSGECLHVLNGFESGTGSISFSPLAQSLIAVGGWNGRLGIYGVNSGDLVKEYEIDEDPARQSSRDKPMMMTMSWREDGNQLALGLYNKSLMTVNVGDLGTVPKVEEK